MVINKLSNVLNCDILNITLISVSFVIFLRLNYHQYWLSSFFDSCFMSKLLWNFILTSWSDETNLWLREFSCCLPERFLVSTLAVIWEEYEEFYASSPCCLNNILIKVRDYRHWLILYPLSNIFNLKFFGFFKVYSRAIEVSVKIKVICCSIMLFCAFHVFN